MQWFMWMLNSSYKQMIPIHAITENEIQIKVIKDSYGYVENTTSKTRS